MNDTGAGRSGDGLVQDAPATCPSHLARHFRVAIGGRWGKLGR